ncbi:MAG: Ref family protein, partial [Gammaproteobacteria bacterium]|nr:Ref family protein [Gammaproteobacteria bacterium]
KGIKGRNPTALEKILANKIGDIGCICCLNKKWYTSDMAEQESTKFVSLHHIEGRTKEWAHAKVLPLCAYHHDTSAPSHAPKELTPIHRGNKKEWIELNGTEDELLKQVYEMIDEDRPWL